MRILHLAPFNTSGVPAELVQAERKLGHYSRLVTLARDSRGYEEDICLNLPWIDFALTKVVKNFVSAKEKLVVENIAKIPSQIPPQWHPNNIVEASLIKLRDWIWMPGVTQAIKKYNLLDFEVYQLDGGLGFFRNSKIILKLHNAGKKIICCYTGSDLRTRGVIPAIDRISDLNVTFEFDHLKLHPNIHHVFFPFDASRFEHRIPQHKDRIKIGHAPTVRTAKGSDVIIPVIKSLEDEYQVELVLIEKLPYKEAIARKADCDIFVDQIGDLGYGINSLEALALGIPTCSCLADGFAEKYPAHPFMMISAENMRAKLVELIRHPGMRRRLSIQGRRWLEANHDSVNTVSRIHELAGLQ